MVSLVKPLAAIHALLFALVLAGPAEAAKRPAKPPASAANVQKCKPGQMWNKKQKKCVQMDSGGVGSDDLYWQARSLVKAGHYDWAISLLAAADQTDPEVLNYLGYSHRKAGRLETGIGFYKRALALDPDYVLVREYLGEGYVSAGKLDLARDQLAEIKARCGRTCPEYRDLAAAIAKAGAPQ